MPRSSNLHYFATELLAWFGKHKRDLPWRRNKDPYRIWVSEIMLQQTRVDTVIPYYERFMEKYPTLSALAEAPEDEVLKLWEGLGYYSRARNLQTAVREVSELYGGVVPKEPEEIAGLCGVGPYTAGAILSIAYDLPEPAVDGNVMRVLSRFFLLEEDVAKPATRVKLEKLVRELIPEGQAGDFNQALMELGALVCTPKSPTCLTCPVMERCEGRIAGKELELPVKKKAKAPRREHRVVALIEGSGENRGKVLVRKRPAEGLLAGMWELPHVLVPSPFAGELDETTSGKRKAVNLQFGAEESANAAEALQQGLLKDGFAVTPLEPMMEIDHVFSHIHWLMQVHRCREADASVRETAGQQNVESAPAPQPVAETAWITPADRATYTFPNVFNRILDTYWENQQDN